MCVCVCVGVGVCVGGCVCVGVGACVRVCVWVCLYSATMSWTYLRGTDQRPCVVNIISGAFAKFFHLRF